MLPERRAPARQAQLRGHNLAVVLGWVAASGPSSRARIAAGTGLTKASVSTLVDALLEAGLLDETPARPSGSAGRPGHELALAARGPVGLGLEVNVDYLAAVAVGLSGQVLSRERVSRDLRGVPERAQLLVRAARAAAGGPGVAGLCVAVPGLVDRDGGLLRTAPNLGWREVDVVAALHREPALAGIPARVGNEANLAALGELWHGAARGQTGFVQVSGEVGVGAGVVLEGSLFQGARGYGGELGHLPVSPGGPPCRCGSSGCLEQVAGQEAILRRAGAASMAQLLDQLAAGRARSLAAVREAGRYLGIGLAAMLNVLDVGTVVLGGSYAAIAPWMLEQVEAELGRRVVSAAWSPVQVLVSELGADAAVHGAAASVLRRVIDDPARHLVPA
jgi:predicted NBD/HSP70 family sugar kinase